MKHGMVLVPSFDNLDALRSRAAILVSFNIDEARSDEVSFGDNYFRF